MSPYHLIEQIKHGIMNLYRKRVSITYIADELCIRVSNFIFNWKGYLFSTFFILHRNPVLPGVNR